MRGFADRGDRRRERTGFTLIELMMVVAIIAILLLIALPTFVGAKNRASDRQATSILHSSLVAARVGNADQGDYAWLTPATLQAEERSITYTDSATSARAGSNQVSVATGVSGGNTYVIMTSLSSSGKCYALLEQVDAATTFQVVSPASSCNAGAFAPGSGWVSSW
jgi:type IV pilus assembly protein PilA